MTLTDFLLARIAEDEAEARDKWCTIDPTPGTLYAQALADCDARRRILRLLATDDNGPYDYRAGYAAAVEDSCRLLALPYADHPDYREEWKP